MTAPRLPRVVRDDRLWRLEYRDPQLGLCRRYYATRWEARDALRKVPKLTTAEVNHA
jgi:hypothetical protein